MRSFRVVRYLRVPLNFSSILATLYFAFALTVAEHVGVFGIALFFGHGLLFFCYAFALQDHVLQGRSEPLVMSTDMIGTYAARGIGTLVVVVFFFDVTDRLQPWAGPQAIGILRLLLIVLLPAQLGALSMTGRFLDALNPVTVLGTIARIPAAYAALTLVIGALWVVPLWLLRSSHFSFAALWRAESFLPLGVLSVIGVRGALMGLLGHIVVLYVWLATFACISGTLYEQRWELGIDAFGSPERKAERLDAELKQERASVLDDLYAKLRGGAVATAREMVRQRVAAGSEPIDEYRWLYAGAAGWPDPRFANYLAQLMLPLLLERRATGEALKITRQRLEVSTDFRPQTSALLLRLVELARAAGDRATARNLLIDFDRHYANDPLGPSVAQLQRDLAQR